MQEGVILGSLHAVASCSPYATALGWHAAPRAGDACQQSPRQGGVRSVPCGVVVALQAVAAGRWAPLEAFGGASPQSSACALAACAMRAARSYRVVPPLAELQQLPRHHRGQRCRPQRPRHARLHSRGDRSRPPRCCLGLQRPCRARARARCSHHPAHRHAHCYQPHCRGCCNRPVGRCCGGPAVAAVPCVLVVPVQHLQVRRGGVGRVG